MTGAFNYATAGLTLCPVKSYDSDAFEDYEIDRAQKTITRATELLPLHTYDPNVIRKFVSKIRVFGNHRLEISFTHKDMFASGNDAVSLTQ